jgi:hypothetical protein
MKDHANPSIQNRFKIKPKEMNRASLGPTQSLCLMQNHINQNIAVSYFSKEILCTDRINPNENIHSKQNKIVFGKSKVNRIVFSLLKANRTNQKQTRSKTNQSFKLIREQ